MRAVKSVVALALLLAVAVPAHAMTWSIGANLGYSHITPDYDGSDSYNTFSWPSAVDPANASVMPGLRFGFAGENPHHELYIDTGLNMFSTDGFSFRDFVTTANYQYNFGSSGSVAPYLTAGGGLTSTGFKNDSTPIDVSAMAGTYGIGLGIRHKMGNGAGTLRLEVRFDRTTEGTDDDVPAGFSNVLIPKANDIGVKLGFDLWDK